MLRAVLLLAPPLVLAAPAPAQVRVERLLSAMGTGLRIELEAPDRVAGLAASEAVAGAIEDAEALLSTWCEDTELERLNRAPVGQPVQLGAELAELLAQLDRLWRETGGAFDPAVGALVEAWDLRGAGRVPGREELERARTAARWELLRLEGSTATRLHGDLRLEEGGFGKGHGLDRAHTALGEVLARGGSGRIDLGGQLLLLGPGPHTVRVADPRDRGRAVLELRVPAGSVATSGNSERAIVVDGVHHGHLLDPATGRPCPDFGSVTVWSTSALRADVLSTALYVLGPRAGLAWAEEHTDVEALFLVPTPAGLTVHASTGLAGDLSPLVEGLLLPGPEPGDHDR